MNNKLLVVTDLGSFKAYQMEDDGISSSPRLELINEFHTREAGEKILNKVTDLAGRYGSPTDRNWGTTWGEKHNLELEFKKRAIRQLADRLNHLLENKEVETCYFAASKEISHQLLDELKPLARAKIEKTVSCDLTKADKKQLLARFNGSA
jgi:hypothetical protein